MSEMLRASLGFKGQKGDTGEIGTPVPYKGTFEQLKNSQESKFYNYIILDSSDMQYAGHWVYYDRKESQWKDGGLYLSYELTTQIENDLKFMEKKVDTNVTRQNLLEQKYDEQIKNMANAEPQSPEIVDARNGFDTLGLVIKQKTYHFVNIEAMKNCLVLIPGDVVQTLGYYEANDGGAGLYKIVNDSSLTSDDGFVHELINGLKAELIMENNTINFKQLGARAENETNFDRHDNKDYLQKYLDFISKNRTKHYKLFIPGGIWCFSETSIKTHNADIFGNFGFFLNGENTDNTIITSLNDEQRYIWKIGGNADFNYSNSENLLHHINIDYITFSSGKYNSINIPKSLNLITKGALYIDNVSFSKFPNIQFNYINGVAFGISTCWELYFDMLNFRMVYNHELPIIKIDEVHAALGTDNPNVSAIDINSIMFEGCNGDYFKFAKNTAFSNNHIHYLNAECSFANGFIEDGLTENVTIASTYNKHHSFFSGGQCGQFTIDAISINNFGFKSHTVDINTYVMDRLFSHDEGGEENNQGSYFDVVINSLQYDRPKIPVFIINQNDGVNINARNRIVINSLNSFSDTIESTALPCVNLKQYNALYLENVIPICTGTSIQRNNITKNNLLLNCYDFVVNSYLNKCLISEAESSNPWKVCVKVFDSNANTRFLRIPNFCFTKIKIRIKIPEGETMQLFYNNGTDFSGSFLSVAGTGKFEWYEFDFTDKLNTELTDMFLSTGNKNALFDCFFCYN